MQELYIGGNQLSELPTDIGNLEHLELLQMAKNQIRALPIMQSTHSDSNRDWAAQRIDGIQASKKPVFHAPVSQNLGTNPAGQARMDTRLQVTCDG